MARGDGVGVQPSASRCWVAGGCQQVHSHKATLAEPGNLLPEARIRILGPNMAADGSWTPTHGPGRAALLFILLRAAGLSLPRFRALQRQMEIFVD